MKLLGDSRRVLLVIWLFAAVLILGGAIFHRSLEAVWFGFGVVLSCTLNSVKVFMIERTVRRALDMAGQGTAAGGFAAGQYFIRFLLTAGVLVLAATNDFISLWGAALGLFSLQVGIFWLKMSLARGSDKAGGVVDDI